MSEQQQQSVYFIGISLPPDLDRTISELKWCFYEQDEHLLKPILPHVTLLHPPSLRGVMPDELLPRIHEVAKRYLPLTIACQDVGFFNRNVAYITVQSQGLYSLQSHLMHLLPPEAQALHYKRPYTPHITIAQAYQPHQLDPDDIEIDIRDAVSLPQQFTVDSVSYFQRILPREYRAVEI